MAIQRGLHQRCPLAGIANVHFPCSLQQAINFSEVPLFCCNYQRGRRAHAGRGEDTQRAIDALETIRANCDALIAMNPDSVVEKALKVAIMVEEREALRIYPQFRDQALAEGDERAAGVYQKVVDSESQHAQWFHAALNDIQASAGAATA
jgi:hypothetical protein